MTPVSFCFVANVNQPRRREAVFELILSNATTADNSTDFNITMRYVRVPMGFNGSFRECLYLLVLDDLLVEYDEVVVLEVRAVSDRDMVQFPEGSESLVFNIFDNDGENNSLCLEID